jgi:hypothetical protein
MGYPLDPWISNSERGKVSARGGLIVLVAEVISNSSPLFRELIEVLTPRDPLVFNVAVAGAL